jgi:hypothetical protein
MKQIFPALGIILFFLALVILSILGPAGSVQAAPPAAPTPVANIAPSDDALNVTFQSQTAIDEDTDTGSVQLGRYEYVDVQHVIDQGTDVNTVTLTIQFSNDGTNWVNGPALATDNAADATDITRVPLFGRYARINENVTNTNTLTVTVIGLAK